ncbi:MAG: hypothetical protein KGD63_06620 [Candidatus Lokiarchaeota archaeon]|nr:hypothetical protein [Candidatus Lokiarchaeota archaeon]
MIVLKCSNCNFRKIISDITTIEYNNLHQEERKCLHCNCGYFWASKHKKPSHSGFILLFLLFIAITILLYFAIINLSPY